MFGETRDGEMRLSVQGEIVGECWHELAFHYPSIELDEFIVMPNHVHGIIAIVDQDYSVGAGLKPTPTKRYPLSEIVRGFKTFSAKRINEFRKMPGIPVWQRNYYEHIIRDDKSLMRIRGYIASNPQRREEDKENSDRKGRDEIDQWIETMGTRPVASK